MLSSKENHPSKILDVSGKEFPKNNKSVRKKQKEVAPFRVRVRNMGREMLLTRLNDRTTLRSDSDLGHVTAQHMALALNPFTLPRV